MRWLGRWALRVLVGFATLSLAAYAVDWLVYTVRGSPQATVTVGRYMAISLKGQKTEYDFMGYVDLPCAVALFPHGNADPCWHLRRNPTQWIYAGSTNN